MTYSPYYSSWKDWPDMDSAGTADLNNGVTFYTATEDTWLVQAWFELITVWDGDAAHADIGPFSAETMGLFDFTDTINGGQNLQLDPSAFAFDSMYYSPVGLAENGVTMLIPSGTALKLVVSQDGLKGGLATGASQGSSRVYIATATPVAF